MTAITMVALVLILVVGAVVGVQFFLAPVDTDDTAARPSMGCEQRTVRQGQRIFARQVRVSVYNGGTRARLADETMRLLVQRGFQRGEVGNAPSDRDVNVVLVLSTQRDDVAARLVARQFGKRVKVRFVDDDLGPGVDVIVGNGFRGLADAKPVLLVRGRSSVCVASPSTAR